jgi:hypothetical protein
MPVFYTFLASSTILTANVIGIYELGGYFINPNLKFSMAMAYTFLGVTCLINYLAFIRKNKYREINVNKRHGFYSVLYIILSFALVIWTSNLHRARNFQLKSPAAASAMSLS